MVLVLENESGSTGNPGIKWDLVKAAQIDGDGPEKAAQVAFDRWWSTFKVQPDAVFVKEPWSPSPTWHGLPVVVDRDVPAGAVYVGVA